MRVEHIAEPELEFGGGGRHIDIRFGITNYGPLDLGSDAAPERIRLGVVGTGEMVESCGTWLERCRGPLEEKGGDDGRLYNLFPRFPGFCPEEGFRSTLALDSRARETLPRRGFEWPEAATHEVRVRSAVEQFMSGIRLLKESGRVDVAVCALSDEVVDLMDLPSEAGAPRLDFHDMLKAQAMDLNFPVQLVLPRTFGSGRSRSNKVRPGTKSLQDEATRAWNFHTALYYKAGGLPWRIARDKSGYTTCFVGVSFYRSLDGGELGTSMAQVFDERGDGIIVRGAAVRMSKHDRRVELSEEDAHALLKGALERYRQEHRTLPARVVVHKTSRFSPSELAGFRSAQEDQRVDSGDFVSVTDSAPFRLFRNGRYPVLRGTLLSLDRLNHVVYTRGSVDFFSTYPGQYIPSPVCFRLDETSGTGASLAEEMLALSKMNWNQTQFDGRAPITIEAARKVGRILKYVPPEKTVAARYCYYM